MMTERSKPTLAVVGATGAVGSVLLSVLSERHDVWGEIRLIASPRSAGEVRQVRGEDVAVRELTDSAFDGVDVAFFAVPSDVASHWAPIATHRGVVVVDCSPVFRTQHDVPLVVAEQNPAQVRNRPRGIIASPNCTTLTMMDALFPLHSQWELSELVVASYQAASGAGQAGAQRLYAEVDALAHTPGVGTHTGGVRRRVASLLPDDSPFPAALAFNVVPWVGDLGQENWSTEEESVREETRKLLGSPHLPVSATCVRVPVVNGHSLAVHATFHKRLSVAQARRALVEAPSVVVLDDPGSGEWPTPTDVVGSDPTFVGRMRQAPGTPHTLDLFVCGDNLRQGGALNVAQIGELVCADLTDGL